MSTPTFYVPPSDVEGDTARLSGGELRHAARTLRLGPGDRVVLLDGRGTLLEAEIVRVGREEAVLRVLSRSVQPPPVLEITLAMGIVPGERYEWAVQKAVELGVSSIVPLVTERTEVKITGTWQRGRRLERIIAEACKQCRRAKFPTLAEPVSLEDLDPAAFDLAVAFWEGPGAGSLRDLAAGTDGPRTCLAVVGPVGGFSPSEAEMMKRRGLVPAGLGPRVLRTETAAAAGVALLQFLWGDMG